MKGYCSICNDDTEVELKDHGNGTQDWGFMLKEDTLLVAQSQCCESVAYTDSSKKRLITVAMVQQDNERMRYDY